jgi:uncharacterized protein with HEPN domain
MRHDREILVDIPEALDSLEKIVAQTNESEFLSNDLHFYVVSQLMTVIGEAAARLSSDLKEGFPAVPWRTIVGLRNVLVQQYFGVLRPMIWGVATTEARSLRSQIAAMLGESFPE